MCQSFETFNTVDWNSMESCCILELFVNWIFGLLKIGDFVQTLCAVNMVRRSRLKEWS